ncbi:MAG TPA: hypothetical protein VM686_32200 [Polyangiaceae bacterium]|nr:hypothetical protein [Polyangiaceae bacterium]
MRSLRLLLLAASCAVAPVWAPSAALAQPSSVSVSAAEALFEEGRTALAAGDLELACARFRESNRLDPAVGTVLNLADCEEKRGKLATAWTLFRSATAELDPSDDRLTIVRQRLVDLQSRTPKLVLELAPGATPNTRARVAGTELGSASFGVPLPLDPGSYEIAVSAPGMSERVFPVTLVEGKTERLVITAGAGGSRPEESEPEAEAPVSASTAGPSEMSRRTWTYVIGGAGIGGLTIGTVTGLLTLRQKEIADANCRDDIKRCNAEGQEANETGRTLGAISAISFVVGLAGVGAATYLLLSEPEDPHTSAIRASIGVNSAGLRFERRF